MMRSCTVPSKKEANDDRKAMLAKTARLRELRLARDAEEQRNAVAAPARKPAVRKTPKRRTPAPWPWGAGS
jgi:hypothetical protein